MYLEYVGILGADGNMHGYGDHQLQVEHWQTLARAGAPLREVPWCSGRGGPLTIPTGFNADFFFLEALPSF